MELQQIMGHPCTHLEKKMKHWSCGIVYTYSKSRALTKYFFFAFLELACIYEKLINKTPLQSCVDSNSVHKLRNQYLCATHTPTSYLFHNQLYSQEQSTIWSWSCPHLTFFCEWQSNPNLCWHPQAMASGELFFFLLALTWDYKTGRFSSGYLGQRI